MNSSEEPKPNKIAPPFRRICVEAAVLGAVVFFAVKFRVALCQMAVAYGLPALGGLLAAQIPFVLFVATMAKVRPSLRPLAVLEFVGEVLTTFWVDLGYATGRVASFPNIIDLWFVWAAAKDVFWAWYRIFVAVAMFQLAFKYAAHMYSNWLVAYVTLWLLIAGALWATALVVALPAPWVSLYVSLFVAYLAYICVARVARGILVWGTSQ